LLCLAVSSLIVVLAAPPVSVFWPPRDIVTDFYQDWASARNWWNDLPIYTNHQVTVPRYIGPVDPICFSNQVNAHPPTSVLMLLPLARLDYRPALLAWNSGSLAMFGVCLWIVAHELGVALPLWMIVPGLALAMLCRPLLQQLIHGQLNLVLLLLLTGAWLADRRGRAGWAGALVGVAVAIKLFPAFLFLYFALRRQWAAMLAGVVTLILLTGLTAAMLGPDTYRTYVQDVLPQLEKFRTSWFNASLVGFWTKLFNPATREEHVEPLWRSAAAARAGIVLSGMVVVAAVAWAVRRAVNRAELDHAFGAAVTGMLLLSPITWDYAFLLLLVPVAVIWRDPPRSEAAKLLLITALAALWFWQKPLCHAIIPGGVTQGVASPIHTVTVLSYQCYSLIVLLVLCVVGSSGARLGATTAAPTSGSQRPDWTISPVQNLGIEAAVPAISDRFPGID
jgi:alpha-1,2-mannosyltransferase